MGGYKHSYLQVNYEIARNPDSTTKARTLILIYYRRLPKQHYLYNMPYFTKHVHLKNTFTYVYSDIKCGYFFAHLDSYSGNFGGNSN